MTCASMIDRMLEADLSELAGRGSSPLAMHLRECGRCRAMATQVISHTRDLAHLPVRSAPARASHAHRNGRVSRYAAIAIAAAVVAVVSRGIDRVDPREPEAVEHGPAARVSSIGRAEVSAPAATEPRHVAASTVRARIDQSRPGRHPRTDAAVRRSAGGARGGGTALRSMTASRAVPVTSEPVVVAAIPRVIATAAVRLDPPRHVPLGSRVSVDPPVGTRAHIIRTASPGVTVVWLYER